MPRGGARSGAEARPSRRPGPRVTRSGAVPPVTSAAASAPSMLAVARSAAAIPFSFASRAPSGRRCRRARRGTPRRGAPRATGSAPPPPRRRARRRCGGRRGTARRAGRARRRGRSRSCSPPAAAPRIRAPSTASVSTSPAMTPQRGVERADRREQRRLVLLEVALVGERQALEQRQHVGQRADHGGRAAADQLGGVGVLLVGHHRGPGREGVGHPDEPEPRVRPPGDLLREAAQMHHRERGRGEQLDDEVPVRDGVERVGGHAVEAELARPSSRGRAGSRRPRAPRRRAARR